MRDLSGGKNNVVARIQIEENNAEIDRITREINELNRAIYPMIKYTYRCVPTSKYSDKQFTEQLMRGIEIRIGKKAAKQNERYIELCNAMICVFLIWHV